MLLARHSLGWGREAPLRRGWEGGIVSRQMSSREVEGEQEEEEEEDSVEHRRGEPNHLLCTFPFSFHTIWVTSGLTCYCVRHAGRCSCVCVCRGIGGGSKAKQSSRKFLKKNSSRIIISPHYWISSEKHLLRIHKLHFCSTYIQGSPHPLRQQLLCPHPHLWLSLAEAAAPAPTASSNSKALRRIVM